MRALRKVFIGLGALFALALVALLVLPLLFRDRLEAHAKNQINKSINARVDWRGLGLSFIRDFPNLTVRVDSLTIVGVDRFQLDTLADIDRFRVVVDVGSVIGSVIGNGQMVVRSVELDRPLLRLTVLEDGTANWNISKPAPIDSSAAPADFNVGLRRFQIRNASISFDNARAGVHALLTGLQHSLSGDFSSERFVLQTQTHADSVTLEFAGMTYLNRVALDIDADLDADMVNKKFTFRDNSVRLNELVLDFSGSVGQSGRDLDLDLTLNAPRTEFKHILSLLPAMYAQDFASLQASGAVAIDARVTGRYGEHAFPSFGLTATVTDGSFRYADLPLPMQNIGVDLAVNNPGRHIDSTVVHIKRFHVELASRPIDATLLLRTPVSDPDIDAKVTGQLDLADVNRALKLSNIEQLNGEVSADLALQGRLSDMSGRRYDRVSARGNAAAHNVAFKTATMRQLIAVEEAQLQLSPQHAELRSFKATIGSSDVQVTGRVENALGYLLRSEDLRGDATLTSTTFNLDEWRTERAQHEIIPVPARIDFALNANIAKLLFNKLQFSNARGRVRVQGQRATLEDFRLNVFGGEIGVTGYYDTRDVARPQFDAKVALKELSIPEASAGLLTIRMLAPVARFVQGNFSADLTLNGALGDNLMPLFEALNGQGSLLTSALGVREFPMLNRIADGLKFQPLKNPTFDGIRSTIEIRGGRLHVRPFEVKLGDTRLTVAGSNGIDQSLQYGLTLAIPRTALGSEATRAVSNLITQSARVGIDLNAPVIALGVAVTGTVTDPAIKIDPAPTVTAARTEVGRAIGQALEQRTEAVGQRVDSVKLEAERRAQAVADSLVRDAETRAAQVREDARKLADNVRAEGNRQADALLARATTPIARAAAQPAADRLRREANARADQIVREADQRAAQIVLQARRRSGRDSTAVR